MRIMARDALDATVGQPDPPLPHPRGRVVSAIGPRIGHADGMIVAEIDAGRGDVLRRRLAQLDARGDCAIVTPQAQARRAVQLIAGRATRFLIGDRPRGAAPAGPVAADVGRMRFARGAIGSVILGIVSRL